MKNILLGSILLMTTSLTGYSQHMKCDSIQNQLMGNVMSNNVEITANLAILLDCGNYNELTKKFFSDKYNVVEFMTEDILRFIGDVHYSVLNQFIDSLVQDSMFQDKMWYDVELARISKAPSTLDVFEANEKFFRRIEPDEAIFEELRIFYTNLKSPKMDVQTSMRVFYTERVKDKEEKDKNREEINWNGYLSFTSLKSETKKVENTDLLVAVYFSRQSGERSRQFEESVLSDSEVNMTLSIQFITSEANCDNPTILSAADQKKFMELFNQPVKTVGQKNTLYLEMFTNGAVSPVFIIFNGTGKAVRTIEFTQSPSDFHRLLKSCTEY